MRTATRTRLALSLLAFLALPAAAAEREHFGARPPSDPAQAPLSKAVLAGETLYLSGELGLLPGRRVPATAEEEARLVLTNVKATLALAGMTMDDLVSVQVFCSDVSHFDAWNAVYRTFFSRAFPARAFVGSGALLFGARFEMQGVAVRRAPPPEASAGDAAAGVVTHADGVASSAALDGVYARLSAAYRALDAEAASAVYTEDVSYLPPGSPVLRGRAEARKGFASFFEALRREGKTAEISFEVLSRGTSADLGWDVGVFTLRTAKEGTAPTTMRGKFVVVARRGADGTWRWQVDAWNDPGRPKAP
jgi:2-iminobutanoate/2-iminopropanoate deaminase